MIFNRTKESKEQAIGLLPEQKSIIVWIEIGATDVDRAVPFYENVFYINIQIRNLFNSKMGLVERNGTGPGICIIERERVDTNHSIKPTFYVRVMHEAVNKVISNGGSVITSPTILKQQNFKGETLIGSNLIDNQMGYIAEVMDTEGNALLIYSHC